jgi:DNA-directed RNA polymerase subunit beta'
MTISIKDNNSLENNKLSETNVYINKKIDKKTLEDIILKLVTQFGSISAVNFMDSLKNLGFRYATNGGISIAIEDLKIPPDKIFLLKEANEEIRVTNKLWKDSFLTDIERYQKILDIWSMVSESLKNRIVQYFKDKDPLNSIYMISFSGARGNISQVRQLIGMRGLMSNQKGQIIDLPILSNFREGLSSSDYIISAYGARKGIVDTALRTADSGYLTRRLVEIGQDIVIREIDCFGNQGIKFDLRFYKDVEGVLKGRTIAHSVIRKGKLILKKNQILDSGQINKIKTLKIEEIYLRSPLTCKAYRTICQYCYGWNLAYQNLVSLGDSVGVIAAQSIGEPGTQMTMRTFHTGGVFTTEIKEHITATLSGTLMPLTKIKAIGTRNQYGDEILELLESVSLEILDWKNEKQFLNLTRGSLLYVKPYTFVKKNQIIADTPSSSFYTRFGHSRNFKALLSTFEGEISFGNLKIKQSLKNNKTLTYNEKAGLMWVLPGKLVNFPNETKIKIQQNSLNSKKSIGKIKLTSSINGSIKFNFSKKEVSISNNLLKKNIFLSLQYKYNGRKQKKIKNLFIKAKSNAFKMIPNITEEAFEFDFLNKNFSFKCFQMLQETKEEDLNWLFFVNLSFYEALNDTILHKNGFIYRINLTNGWISHISNVNKNLLNNKNKSFQLAFPGEKLFDVITIKNLVYYKLFSLSSYKNVLVMYPVYKCQLKKNSDPIFKPLLNNLNSDLKFIALTNYIFHNQVACLEIYYLFLNYKKISLSSPQQFFSNLKITINKNNQNFQIIDETRIELKNIISGWCLSPGNKINLNFLVHNHQYIDAYTILGYLEYKPIANKKVFIAKSTKTDKQSFLFVFEEHILKIHFEGLIKDFSKQLFYEKNYQIKKNLLLGEPGLFLSQTQNSVTFRKVVPFFLTKGAVVRCKDKEFIKKGDNFAILVNYRQQTNDIVQGLPKIEELIELRGKKKNSILAERPGIVYKIKKKLNAEKSEIEIEVIENEESTLYLLESIEDLLVREFDFLNLGEQLTSGSIDPYELLRIFCNYYYKTDGPIYGLYKSIYKVGQILVNSIQAIYKSQGIDISEKHIELIVRQMMSQAEVIDGGDTPLLTGESIELYLIEDLSNILFKNNLLIPIFQPVLKGVTASSLKGESFLASASFQETRRILSEAAIEGKTDWLRSLKANVITGHLIPSGTGFYNYQNKFEHPQFYKIIQLFESREQDFVNSSEENKKVLSNKKGLFYGGKNFSNKKKIVYDDEERSYDISNELDFYERNFLYIDTILDNDFLYIDTILDNEESETLNEEDFSDKNVILYEKDIFDEENLFQENEVLYDGNFMDGEKEEFGKKPVFEENRFFTRRNRSNKKARLNKENVFNIFDKEFFDQSKILNEFLKNIFKNFKISFNKIITIENKIITFEDKIITFEKSKYKTFFQFCEEYKKKFRLSDEELFEKVKRNFEKTKLKSFEISTKPELEISEKKELKIPEISEKKEIEISEKTEMEIPEISEKKEIEISEKTEMEIPEISEKKEIEISEKKEIEIPENLPKRRTRKSKILEKEELKIPEISEKKEIEIPKNTSKGRKKKS